jgi:hypothetical protein
MADPIVTISGVVTACFVDTDTEGKRKPALKVELLQITQKGSNQTVIKDDDLNAKYPLGTTVSLQCVPTVWQWNGKVGVSYRVFKGDFANFSLSFGHDSSLPKKSEMRV